MKIIEIDKIDNSARFIYWNWRKFKFEYTCWANNIKELFGKTKGKKHLCIMIYR